MFRSFFLDRRWQLWSIAGTALMCLAIWYRVQLDVQINEWFGAFYDTIQKALSSAGSVTFPELLNFLWAFAAIAGVSILVAVLLDFFLRHYIFRWRTAMNDHYVRHWPQVRSIEGASQRIQEDTMRFARIVELLGVPFVQSVLTLFAFLPMLWAMSSLVTELPWIGAVPYSLVWVALLWSAFGTLLLAIVGIRLPGLEFNNQRVEAAFRKELVLGEDYADRAQPPTLAELFSQVRQNYFVLFRNYLYFDVAKYSYLQFGVLIPFLSLGPTIVTGTITLGVLQQIMRAFDKVETSFQFLVNSWSTIIELISIYKRLSAFEQRLKQIGGGDNAGGDNPDGQAAGRVVPLAGPAGPT